MKNKLFPRCRSLDVNMEKEPNHPDSSNDRSSTRPTVANHSSLNISVLKSPISTVKTFGFSENEILTGKMGRSKSFSEVTQAILFGISLKKKVRSRKTLQFVGDSTSSDSNSEFLENEILTRKMGRSRSFSEVAKAILFGISLKKKVRNRKTVQLVDDAPSTDSSKSNAFSDKSKRSSSTSCSSSWSSSSPPKSTFEKINRSCKETCLLKQENLSIDKNPLQIENRVFYRRRNSNGLWLILSSLIITIFYGRLSAILLSSLFLYMMCHLRNSQQKAPAESVVVGTPETQSVARDYRKRVIMEGMLQRKDQHQRGH